MDIENTKYYIGDLVYKGTIWPNSPSHSPEYPSHKNWWKWWNNEYETSIWLNFEPIFGDMEDDQGRILPSVPLIKKMTKTKIDTTQVKCWVKISSKNGQKIDENGHWGPTGLNSVGPCVNTTSSGAEKEVHLYV